MPPMNEPLRVAHVGVGGFGKYRRERMRETGLFRIVAMYDINPVVLEQAAREENALAARSLEEMLDQPGLEAVIISTGAKFHAEQALAALERGLHVFVEKPVCATPQEAEALLAAQKRTGKVVMVGHTDHSTCGVSLTTRRLIADGTLGTVASFEKTTAHSGGFHIKPGDWRGDPQKNPGGMLFQCGVHAFHELMFYFGPIRAVFSQMRYDVHRTPTADVACCVVQFCSGLVGTLNAYHVTPYRHTFFLFGTKANLYRDDRFFDEGTNLVLQRVRLDGHKEPHEPVAVMEPTDECGNVRKFYAAIRSGAAPYPSLVDGVRAVDAVFAAERSAKSGRMEEVPVR